MNLLLAALAVNSYTELKPYTDRKAEIEDLRLQRVRRVLPANTQLDLKELSKEEDTLERKIITIALRQSIRKDNLFEDEEEVTALDDLTSAIKRLHPDATALLNELGSYLVAPERIQALYPHFTRLLDGLNLKDIVTNNTGFGGEIPFAVYRTALEKQRRIIEFCYQNNMAMLCMITGDL